MRATTKMKLAGLRNKYPILCSIISQFFCLIFHLGHPSTGITSLLFGNTSMNLYGIYLIKQNSVQASFQSMEYTINECTMFHLSPTCKTQVNQRTFHQKGEWFLVASWKCFSMAEMMAAWQCELRADSSQRDWMRS